MDVSKLDFQENKQQAKKIYIYNSLKDINIQFHVKNATLIKQDNKTYDLLLKKKLILKIKLNIFLKNLENQSLIIKFKLN